MVGLKDLAIMTGKKIMKIKEDSTKMLKIIGKEISLDQNRRLTTIDSINSPLRWNSLNKINHIFEAKIIKKLIYLSTIRRGIINWMRRIEAGRMAAFNEKIKERSITGSKPWIININRIE